MIMILNDCTVFLETYGMCTYECHFYLQRMQRRSLPSSSSMASLTAMVSANPNPSAQPPAGAETQRSATDGHSTIAKADDPNETKVREGRVIVVDNDLSAAETLTTLPLIVRSHVSINV